MSHNHFRVQIEGGPRCGEFVDVLIAVVVGTDGTVALESAGCVTPELAATVLRELAYKALADGLNRVEPRVEP